MLKKLLWLVPLGLAVGAVIAGAGVNDKVKPKDAPEFDARTSGAALALLVGGVLLLSDLRRRNDPDCD